MMGPQGAASGQQRRHGPIQSRRAIAPLLRRADHAVGPPAARGSIALGLDFAARRPEPAPCAALWTAAIGLERHYAA